MATSTVSHFARDKNCSTKLKVYYPYRENNLCMCVLHNTGNVCINVTLRGFSVTLVAVDSSMYYIF